MEFLLTFLTILHARIRTSRYCRQHSYTPPSFDGWAAGLAETCGSSSGGSFAAEKSKVSFCPTLFFLEFKNFCTSFKASRDCDCQGARATKGIARQPTPCALNTRLFGKLQNGQFLPRVITLTSSPWASSEAEEAVAVAEATSAVVIAEVAVAAGEASETAVVAVVVEEAEEAAVVGLRSPS
jgi:hypothetical protein